MRIQVCDILYGMQKQMLESEDRMAKAKLRWIVRAAFFACMAFDWLGACVSSDYGVCCAMRNNTFLAYLPVEISLHLSAHRRAAAFWALFALWAIFFPNAPYVLTDYFHLAHVDPYIILESGKRTSLVRPELGLWLTFAIVSTSALVCTIFGTWSLDRVIGMLQERWKRPGLGWRFLFVMALTALSSVGIFLGRFPRLHSIHLLTRPGYAIEKMAASCSGDLLEFAALLTIVQVVLWGCMRFVLEAAHDEPHGCSES